MDFSIKGPDPFNILTSTKNILESAQYVFLNENSIKKTAVDISPHLNESTDTLGEGFNRLASFEDNLQLAFIEDSVNFCFWSDINVPRWQVEYPSGDITEGGWFALQKCFERAIAEEVPVLDAGYLANITTDETARIFRSANEHIIPLVEERCACLREAGLVLLDKYHGKFINVLESSGYDAVRLVRQIVEDFPCFQDVSLFQGTRIPFLKRAQIVANDVSYVLDMNRRFRLKNFNQLTAFADYKIPQILRFLGVTSYEKKLANKIDMGENISQGSQEEIEIRSGAIWGVELLRQELQNKYSAAMIDNALWILSQKQAGMPPYHRTRTIFY